jgi:hypothetical protein
MPTLFNLEVSLAATARFPAHWESVSSDTGGKTTQMGR